MCVGVLTVFLLTENFDHVNVLDAPDLYRQTPAVPPSEPASLRLGLVILQCFLQTVVNHALGSVVDTNLSMFPGHVGCVVLQYVMPCVMSYFRKSAMRRRTQ